MTHARRILAAALLLVHLAPPAPAQIVGPFGNTWFGRPVQTPPPICYGPQCQTPQYAGPIQYAAPQQYSQPPQVRYAGPGEFQPVDPEAPGAAATPAGQSGAAPPGRGVPGPEALALPKTVTRSIARLRASKPIQTEHGPGIGSGIATGTLIAPGLILTCGHILREQPTTFSVEWPDGTVAPARLAASDMGLDVSLWEIAPTTRPPVPLATVDPMPGAWVVWLGYGGTNQLGGNPTTARGYVQNGQWLEIAAPVRQGDSGGPILNDRLELVAIIEGTGNGVTAGPCCRFIRQFLARHNRLPAAPAQPPNNTPATPPASDLPPIAASPPAAQPPAEPPPAAEPDPRLPRLEAALDKLRGQLDETRDKAAAAAAAAAEAAREAAAKIRHAEEKAAAAVANAAAKAAELKNRHTDHAAAEPPADANPGGLGAILDKAATWGLTELLIGLGLGAWPAGLTAAGLWWIAKRRGKKKLAELKNRRGGSAVDTPEPADSEPDQPATLLLRRNRYIPHESNTIDKAWADAHATLVEKYPGWKAPLKAAEDLKDQILAGIPRKQIEER